MTDHLQINTGITLKRSDDGTAQGTLTDLGYSTAPSPPNVQPEIKDGTHQGTEGGYRVFRAGLIDPGEVTNTVFIDPTSQQYTDLIDDAMAGTLMYLEWEWNKAGFTGPKYGFQGIATVTHQTELGEFFAVELSLKISGKPTFTAAVAA
jgi:hypothetical protein